MSDPGRRAAAAPLDDYYLADPRLILIPIEHLSPNGISRHLAQLLVERCAWGKGRVDLLDRGFDLYWHRVTTLARRSPAWSPPRLRHLAIIREPLSVRPYVQLLNTSAWLLYECDLDPDDSHPEFLAYLLIHGDRLVNVGDVTLAALHDAAYWFERFDDELRAFQRAAEGSKRPDADAFRALAASIDWLRDLADTALRSPAGPRSAYRAIPATGLLVPRALEGRPDDLVARWRQVASGALDAYRARWRGGGVPALRRLCDWLATEPPRLLVTTRAGRIAWDPDHAERLGALRGELRDAGAATIDSIAADLATIRSHTDRFFTATVDPGALPEHATPLEEQGYSYLHPGRRLVAYNLHEPGIERLSGPALPYAREMLGGRTAHEWAHLTVEAGWVPLRISVEAFAERRSELTDRLASSIAAAPVVVRERTAADVAQLASSQARSPSGSRRREADAAAALVDLLVARLGDYQANLVAMRLMSFAERETYVRHNIRTLRGVLGPAHAWRMLVRYLYEYQYLSFSAVPDRLAFFVSSTWFDADFLAPGTLDVAAFVDLAAAVRRLCEAFAVDETRFRFAPLQVAPG